MIVSIVPCPFSVSRPILHAPVSGVLPGFLGVSVSLCALSLVSLSISLGVLVSLCVCLSMSVSVYVPVFCHCFCLSLCVSMILSVYVCVPVSLSLSQPVSLTLHLCLPVSPCLSPGAIQSFAGFTDYFTAMAQEGWFPLLCVGLRPQWENHHLQDLQDSYGQEWVGPMTPSFPVPPVCVVPLRLSPARTS